jgi:hypothetical protein
MTVRLVSQNNNIFEINEPEYLNFIKKSMMMNKTKHIEAINMLLYRFCILKNNA